MKMKYPLNFLLINTINRVREVYLDIHQQDRDFLQSRSRKSMQWLNSYYPMTKNDLQTDILS